MIDEDYAPFVDKLIELSNARPPTPSEVEAMKNMVNRLQTLEYEEYIVSCPQPTNEDLLANHATGLSVMEKIVRCKACKSFIRDATPEDTEYPHFCTGLGIDLKDGSGFCAWGREPKGDT